MQCSYHMRVAFVKRAGKKQARQNQCNGFMIGQAYGRLIARSDDPEDTIFLLERDTLLGKETQVAVYRTAVDLELT
jgi:hypothetical protein